jgi:hypothetical protein
VEGDDHDEAYTVIVWGVGLSHEILEIAGAEAVLVAQGFMWSRMARVAGDALDRGTSDAAFYQAKIATGRFFTQRIPPQTSSLFDAIMAGGHVITDIEEQTL